MAIQRKRETLLSKAAKVVTFDSRYTQRGVQWAVKEAGRQAGIKKEVSVHTLRHTYATHLLEDRIDIISIQKLLVK